MFDEVGEFEVLVYQIEQQKIHFMGQIMRHRCLKNDLLTEWYLEHDQDDGRTPD